MVWYCGIVLCYVFIMLWISGFEFDVYIVVNYGDLYFCMVDFDLEFVDVV